MSGQWHGGKGDKPRPLCISYEEYANRFERIFGRSANPSSGENENIAELETSDRGYYLFLDDYRNPEHAFLRFEGGIKSLLEISSTSKDEWKVVRSYEEFVDVLENRGVPRLVSLDHDLTWEHIDEYMNFLESGIYHWGKLEETGYDCLIYLMNYCTRNNSSHPDNVFIHTANDEAFNLMSKYYESRRDN